MEVLMTMQMKILRLTTMPRLAGIMEILARAALKKVALVERTTSD